MIYNFDDFKAFVHRQFGIDPDKFTSQFKPITEKLTRAQLDASVEINIDGILFTDRKGIKHKGFLFIESGYSHRTIEKTGTRLPKFHILNCRTIIEQKQRENFNGHYVFSTDITTMEEIDGSVQELSLCGNCHALNQKTIRGMKTSQYIKQFILTKEEEGVFFDEELPKDITTGFWGYTADWDDNSRSYRMNRKFTCEDCGINLNQNFVNGYYLETHHMDGNPKNNSENNLKCLCVLCHANVDKFHRENYSRGSGKRKLIDFIRLFEDELRKIGNKFLDSYKNI